MNEHVSYRLVRALLLVASLLAATACTVRVVMPEVPASHPAHPDAEAAPLPEPSPLLDSYRPVAPPPEMEPMGHGEMDHEGMDHGEMDHGAMGHEAMDHGEEEEAEIDHEAMGHGAAAAEEEATEEPEEDPHAEHRAEPPPSAGAGAP